MWWWIATKHTLVLIHKHTVSFCEKFDNTKNFPYSKRVAHGIFIIQCVLVDDGINWISNWHKNEAIKMGYKILEWTKECIKAQNIKDWSGVFDVRIMNILNYSWYIKYIS